VKELDRLTKEDFDPYVGDVFELDRGGAATLSLELVAVESLSSGVTKGAPRTPFSLTFRSPGERRHVEQHIFTVLHVELGTMDVFLVPIGPDEVGMRYEAVFT